MANLSTFLAKIFKPNQKKGANNFNLALGMKGYEPSFTAFGTQKLYSDLVLSSIKLKQRFFGKLEPRHVRSKDGKLVTITDSPVARLMRTPNSYQTTYDFLTQAYFMREKWSNCYILADYYKTKEGNKYFTGMYVLLPNERPLLIEDDSGKLFLEFYFNGYGSPVVFPYEDIIIWRKDMQDYQYQGGGLYDAKADADLLTSLDAYHQIKQTIAEAAKLSCTFDGILKVNTYAADNSKVQAVRDAFIKDIQSNAGGIPVLDNQADYQSVTRQLKLVDAATLKELKENVLLHTGVTIEMLEGKFTNQDKEAFYENHIEPAALSLGQAMSKVFFSQWQTSYGDQIILYPHKVQLMATSEIVSIISSTISAGVFSIDEYREMLGYAPLENGEGNVRPRGFNNLDGTVDETIDETITTDPNGNNSNGGVTNGQTKIN